jgi:ATP-dependent RNA helicase RhlB
MGFLDETREIMDKVVNKKQTALFSATFNHKVMNLVDQFMKNPKLIEIEEATTIDLKTFQHYFVAVSITRKRALMYTLIKEQKPEKCIIFVRTKSQCKLVHDKLFTKDYKVGLLHGDLPQFKRDKILQQFKAGEYQYFVATDVASRGLHIDGVTHIINFDMPDEVEEYIHRVGRTARMGKSGKAFTFVTKVDGEKFINLEKSLNMQIPEHIIPDFKTGLDEFGNEINIRESEQDDGEEKSENAVIPESISTETDLTSNSKEGSFVYSKTTFETPKGFGKGL